MCVIVFKTPAVLDSRNILVSSCVKVDGHMAIIWLYKSIMAVSVFWSISG